MATRLNRNLYISKLHLNGFKSFLHKTDLEFGKGITVVVGPNGCGKTNIVDAIRWILGEQKTSILRSTKMEDVIFNGTKNRKPIGFCEASLTIHNNRGMLPIEFNDVKITRRLFRTGESEYLLNNSPCRLKDVFELFVDTGMSSDAYSVIELRMVDSILSHNASDRRKMFEEASGINHYKKQRQSTFRKLDSTMSDLDRVKDILFEVEKNVNSFKRQLKRFERHKKLSEKLESSQILLAQIEIQLIDNKISPLIEKLSDVKGKQDSLSGQTSLDEELIKQVDQRYEVCKVKLDDSRLKLENINNDLSSVNNTILINTEQRRNSENLILHNNDEITHSTTRIETFNNQILKIKSKIKSFYPVIEEFKENYQKANNNFQSYDKKYKTANNELLASKKQTDSVVNEYQNNEFNLKLAKLQFSEANTAINEIEQKITENSNYRKHIEADINIQQIQVVELEKNKGELNSNLETSQSKHSELEEILLNKNNKLNLLKNDITSLKSKYEFYNEILEKNDGMSSGVQYILAKPQKFKGVEGVVSDLIDTSEKYRSAIDVALGDLSSMLVVDTRKNARQIIEIIKKIGNLQISIIPLDALPKTTSVVQGNHRSAKSCIKTKFKYNKLFDYLLKNTFVLNTAKEVDSLPQTEFQNAIWVTLSGEYFDGSIILKSVQKHSTSSVIGRKKQLLNIEKRIAKKLENKRLLESEITTLKKEANSCFEKCKILSESVDKEISKCYALENKLQKHELRLTQHDNLFTELKKQKESVKENLKKINSNILTLKTTLQHSQNEVEQAKQKKEELNASIQDILKNRNALQQTMLDARVCLVEKEKELEGLEFRLKTFTDNILDLNKQNDRFNKENFDLKNLIQCNISEVTKHETLKNELLENQSKLQALKNELENSANSLYQERQELQKEVRNRQKAKDIQMEVVQNIQLQLSEMNNKKEIIRHKIKDLYKQKIPTNKIDLTEIDIDELRKQADSIDKSISKIGPVNLAVQDEFDKESERYTFLKEQFDDLTSSEKTLKETIQKLDSEARQRFINTFEKISKHFKETYTMFFEGGEAFLRLIGDDDPLEADIEIIARPPGKRAQTIRMLSAGEKALTAISLLFAIYLVKPSPFCILDEIDAPLDDSNINKFTNVLKKFENKTQFIVVTHNKLTMEKADYLYGVTQEEEGVSKIVSVKFKDNEELKFAS